MIKIKNVLNSLLLGLMALPVLMFADEDGWGNATAVSSSSGGASGLMGVIEKIESLFSAILPLILTLALIYFLWALANYMLKAGEEQADARQQMVWGIIILFVMVSLWGLVGLLSSTLFG